MNDVAYCLRQDERERKSLARMSRYKKNGSRTNYVQLRQNNMTQKEWKKMNGSVETVNLCKKYTRDEFIALSYDMRRLYIQHLIDTYNARRKDIAAMMGMTYAGFVQMSRSLFPTSPFKNEGKGAKPTQAWLDFMSDKVEEPEAVPENVPEDAPVVVKVPSDTPKVQNIALKDGKADVESIRLRVNGQVTPSLLKIFDFLSLLPKDSDYTISLEVYPVSGLTCTPL